MKITSIVVKPELPTTLKEIKQEVIEHSVGDRCNVEFEFNGERYIVEYNDLVNCVKIKG